MHPPLNSSQSGVRDHSTSENRLSCNPFGKGRTLLPARVLHDPLRHASANSNEARSRANTNDIPGSSVNGEPIQGVEAASQRPNGAWAAVIASPVEADERLKCNYGPHSYGTHSNWQSPNQSSNAPSLISISNSDSTPAINSLSSIINLNSATTLTLLSNIYKSLTLLLWPINTMVLTITQPEPSAVSRAGSYF